MKNQETPYDELDPDFMQQEISQETLSRITTANKIVTTGGMTSLGLLAMLITHNNTTKQGWATESIIAFDIATFITAIAGKAAIVLFFNEGAVIDAAKKIKRGEVPDYFKFRGRSLTQHLQWSFNTLRTITASLFWATLAKDSFEKSGQLLSQFSSTFAKDISPHIGQWYVYSPFVIASFYANMIGWPSIHDHASNQRLSLINYFRRDEQTYLINADIQHRIGSTINAVLKELQREIKRPNLVISPTIDTLHNRIQPSDVEMPNHVVSSTDKIGQLLALENHQLRSLLITCNTTSNQPPSPLKSVIKQALAFSGAGMTSYGFKNILGLSDNIWGNWGAKNVSTYFAGPSAYISMIDVVFITVYPMLCDLFDVFANGRVGSAISNKALGFTFFMVAFVGIVGGLANAEQSDLDQENSVSMAIALIASFLLDSVAIYNIFNSNFERNIENSNSTCPKMGLRQSFLKFERRKGELLNISSSSSEKQSDLTLVSQQNAKRLNEHHPHLFQAGTDGINLKLLIEEKAGYEGPCI